MNRPKNKSWPIYPFMLHIKDPYRYKSYRGNTKRHLTKLKPGSIIGLVKNHKRKDDMATTKNKKQKAASLGKSIIWLVFAAQQAFMGYVLLSNFDNYLVVASALASLGIAGAVVVSHFIRANK